MVITPSTTTIKNQWLAHLALEFERSQHGTQLTRTRRNGPLLVQKAFYPEGRDCAHIYLLHPPAGIVSGDELRLTMDIKQAAHTLVTTPGANRFYRAREDLSIGDPLQTQITTLHLESLAKCENFPQETIVYNGADGVNTVDIHLARDSVYLGWDITCLGLPSSQQPFVKGRYTQLNRLFCENKLVYHDRISISAENNLLNHPAGLAGNSVFATFIIYAPDKLADNQHANDLVASLRAQIEALQADNKISICNLQGLLIIRYLGQHANECKDLFMQLWLIARPLCLDKPAIQPRIWHT
ncbi:urease accessory protein UreD [Psychromonas sp.]|uniref:urease accessory protein UreD n=1 Tax=Psychromonas sp. TaxID=1884585 RepID=UPI003563E285